jgi:predicted GIY-YIG superfamily endonuclease
MASRSRVIYVGVTGDLERRVAEHRDGSCDGFTAAYSCNRLVWFERYSSPGAAIDREKQLKEGSCDGFTAAYLCDRLVWFERYSSPGSAIAREKQLKGWVRAKKIALIQKTNPTWEDLSLEWGKSFL